jgi:hypothetical protein
MRGGNTSTPWQSIVLRLSLNDETAITPTLQQLNSSMHDMLSVGSYPVTGQVTPGHAAPGTPVPWLDQALFCSALAAPFYTVCRRYTSSLHCLSASAFKILRGALAYRYHAHRVGPICHRAIPRHQQQSIVNAKWLIAVCAAGRRGHRAVAGGQGRGGAGPGAGLSGAGAAPRRHRQRGGQLPALQRRRAAVGVLTAMNEYQGCCSKAWCMYSTAEDPC